MKLNLSNEEIQMIVDALVFTSTTDISANHGSEYEIKVAELANKISKEYFNVDDSKNTLFAIKKDGEYLLDSPHTTPIIKHLMKTEDEDELQ